MADPVTQTTDGAVPDLPLDFPEEHANEDGWTDWIHPLPGYLMKCCDCGLVHEMELRIDDAGQPNFRMRRSGLDQKSRIVVWLRTQFDGDRKFHDRYHQMISDLADQIERGEQSIV